MAFSKKLTTFLSVSTKVSAANSRLLKAIVIVNNFNIDLSISVLYYTASAIVTRGALMRPDGMSDREAFVQIISNFFRGISTAKGLQLIDDNLKRYKLSKTGNKLNLDR